jgi:dTDP-4-dehydrorhamnose reductase
MKALITGAGGQLASELLSTVPHGSMARALGRAEMDVTDPDAIRRALETHRPTLLINAAAYTAVDRAEEEPVLAQAVNGDGPGHLARAAREYGIRLVHVSTDFVFDGRQSTPYAPSARPAPLGVYGTTKRDGERQVRDVLHDDALIVRTSWVYSRFGHNFVKTMLRLMAERDRLGVVADQVGSPTWARGLAEGLWALAGDGITGLWHWSDAGVCSWYDFAVAIQEEALALGLLERAIPVTPVGTADYPTPAARPAYSVLDKTATWERLGPGRHWRVALRAMLREWQERGDTL